MFELNRLADEFEKIRTENEQLRAENEGLMKLKEITFKEAEELLDHEDFDALVHNIAIEVKNIESSK